MSGLKLIFSPSAQLPHSQTCPVTRHSATSLSPSLTLLTKDSGVYYRILVAHNIAYSNGHWTLDQLDQVQLILTRLGEAGVLKYILVAFVYRHINKLAYGLCMPCLMGYFYSYTILSNKYFVINFIIVNGLEGAVRLPTGTSVKYLL